jgi:GrpB-like predicted nucleotidyltransferase (UPF0157 family)
MGVSSVLNCVKMIEIVTYKDSWPSEFIVIGSALRKGLGKLAVRIDHIGSTSVPGLAAKDIIDIQISVLTLSDEVHQAMSAMGYTRTEIFTDHRPARAAGDEKEWQKWLFGAPLLQRRTNTHMRVMGHANQRYPLLFRDYLRAHPATAEAYAELKRRLAQNLADPKTYPDVKDPAVDLIYLAAEEWAMAIKWVPGESDA